MAWTVHSSDPVPRGDHQREEHAHEHHHDFRCTGDAEQKDDPEHERDAWERVEGGQEGVEQVVEAPVPARS
jgi:hypothetical protein